MLRKIGSTKVRSPASLIALLKACAKEKDLHEGKKLYSDIQKTGFLEKSICLGNTLVSMYAKCGALAKAEEVLDKLQLRDVVSWNALIAGYAQNGRAKEVLNCYARMGQEGFSPNEVTFVCILKACASLGAADEGKQVHAEIIQRGGLLKENIFVGTALVDMLAKCGELEKAQDVFDELQVKNVVSWNALLAGYVQHGYGGKALACFEKMHQVGPPPDIATFVCALKACGNIGAFEKGKRIHAEILEQVLLEKNAAIGTALVEMYARCGALGKAQKVFDELQVKNVASWNTLIMGYTLHGQNEEALHCFEKMQDMGTPPNRVTFISLLKACGSIGATSKGKELHYQIVKMGLLEKDSSIGTAIVDMYAKCGLLDKAQEVFDKLPIQDVVSWNALIVGYAQQGLAEESLNRYMQMQRDGISPTAATFLCILKACGALESVEVVRQVHDEIMKSGLLANDVAVGTALLDAYGKRGALKEAQEVFDGLKVRNVVSWSALIEGYVEHGFDEQALGCFEWMQHEAVSPNTFTFAFVLKACSTIRALSKGMKVHADILNKGLQKDILVSTSLVDMYIKSGALELAQQLFDELPHVDVVSWNVLITGYVKEGRDKEAIDCFDRMQGMGLSPDTVTFVCILKALSNIGAVERGKEIHFDIVKAGMVEKVAGTALVDMYAKYGMLGRAQELFDELQVQDVMLWSTLILGYAHNGCLEEALEYFELMLHEGCSPSVPILVCVLKICGSVGLLDKGKYIHYEIVRDGLFETDLSLGTALVDMYAKCGVMKDAEEVFEELLFQDLVSWNVLVAGSAHHGHIEKAVNCFEHMQWKGLYPNTTTFTIMLNACSHSGLLERGLLYLINMSKCHNVHPNMEHYTCMVDLFARAGQFDRALALISWVPTTPYLPMWSALLNACQNWGNVKLGKWIFEYTIQLVDDDVASYISMSKICLGGSVRGDIDEINAFSGKYTVH